MSSPTSTTSTPPASTQTSAIFVDMNPHTNLVTDSLHAPSVEQSMQMQCFEDCLIRDGTMHGPARWPGIRVWDEVPDGINWPNA